MMVLRTKPAPPARFQLFAGLFPAVSVVQKLLGLFRRAEARPSWSRAPIFPSLCGSLEEELQAELNFPRVPRLERLAKGGTIRDVAVHAVKLRVVKQVVELRAEFGAHSLRQREALEQARIEVGNARAAANRAWRVADGARRRPAECRVVGEGVLIEHHAGEVLARNAISR